MLHQALAQAPPTLRPRRKEQRWLTFGVLETDLSLFFTLDSSQRPDIVEA